MKKDLKNSKKADLNKDGQLSGYERKRGMAIEEALGAKAGTMILAADGELISYGEFKKKKLQQQYDKGRDEFFKEAEKEISKKKLTKKEKYDAALTLQKDKKVSKDVKNLPGKVDPKTYAKEFEISKESLTPGKPNFKAKTALKIRKFGPAAALIGLGAYGYEAYQGYKARKKSLKEKKLQKKKIGGIAFKGFKNKTPIY